MTGMSNQALHCLILSRCLAHKTMCSRDRSTMPDEKFFKLVSFYVQVWNGSCVAIKTHEGSSVGPAYHPKQYEKAIVIIRSPYDSILAEYKQTKWTDKYKHITDDIFAGRGS